MKKRTRISLTIIAVIIIGALVGLTAVKAQLEKNLLALSDMAITDVNLQNTPDGTYTGSYKAFPVSAVVKVTVQNHKITGIELVEHKNGQGKAAEVIPDKVVEKQSLDVDIVSGATYSSKVILKSIENALSSANK